MKSSLYHLQLNIDYKNISFYKELFTFLNWTVIFEMPGLIGFKSSTKEDIWFVECNVKDQPNYDAIGLNHISVKVETQSNIDESVEYLLSKGIETLFDTPKHRAEFSSSPDDTYYQVMFKSPDNILFEIVYVGPKQ